ncbi:uncharacterized protein LOC144770837 [Lissotriton helveticus]
MWRCEASNGDVTWNWIRKWLLIIGAFMDVIGVFLLAFRFHTIVSGVICIASGSTVLFLYLLTSLSIVAQWFKKHCLPTTMNRTEDHVTQGSWTVQGNTGWDTAVYDVPTYEEVVGPINSTLSGIWTTGVLDDKPPPYSAVIKVPATPCTAGPVSQQVTPCGRGVCGAEDNRGTQEPMTGPALVLKILKPHSPLRGPLTMHELIQPTEGSPREETQTPPPSYEDAVDDDVFYPTEWNPTAGLSLRDGV